MLFSFIWQERLGSKELIGELYVFRDLNVDLDSVFIVNICGKDPFWLEIIDYLIPR